MSKNDSRTETSNPYTHVFPAIRGIQAGREYYTTMIPLSVLSELFLFNEDAISPELRAQRVINKARVKEMTRYVISSPHDYTFSAITASIDRRVKFKPLTEYDGQGRIGLLSVPMDAKFLINDGQHRKAGLAEAIKANPSLRLETIAVVLFVDAGLKRSQQMFADLNKYAVKPTRSLGVLYDHKDPMAEVARQLIIQVPLFKDRIEREKTTISNRSTNLLTLSAVYQATASLLNKRKLEKVSREEEIVALEYWVELSKHIREWQTLNNGRISAAELRKNFIHSHGVTLHAFGILGNALIRTYPDTWKQHLRKIEKIDWAKENPLWEGRAMIGGRLTKAITNVLLTANYLKNVFGLPLTKEEQRLEKSYQHGRSKQEVIVE